MAAIDTTSETATPATNAEAFGAVASSLAQPDTSASDAATAVVPDPPAAEVEAADAAPASAPDPSKDASSVFDAMAPQLVALIATEVQKLTQAAAPAETPKVETPEPASTDLFASLARQQLGDDATHVPDHMIAARSQGLAKLVQWQQYANRSTLTPDQMAQATRNVGLLETQLGQNLYEVKQAARVAKLEAELESMKARPQGTAEARQKEYTADVATHITSNAAKLPHLAAAIEKGEMSIEQLLHGLDFGGDQKALDDAIVSRMTETNRLRGIWGAKSAAAPAATTAATTPKPIGNPGILTPGTAPGAASVPGFPQTNDAFFAALKQNLGQRGNN